METRILVEVEEMISKVREQQGRPFDMKRLITSCVANVVMNMIFGRRFHHSDPTFQELIHNVEACLATFSPIVEIFPALRFLPYFKNCVARHVSAVQRLFSSINDNIATCTEVCN